MDCADLNEALRRFPHNELCELMQSGHRFSKLSEDDYGVRQSDEGFIVRLMIYEATTIKEDSLYFEVMEQRLELLRIMMEARGIGIDDKVVDCIYSTNGHSPFFHAVMSRDELPDFGDRMKFIANRLIEMGADPLAEFNENGDTLLHIMAGSRNLECIGRLYSLDRMTPDQKRALTRSRNKVMETPIIRLAKFMTSFDEKDKLEEVLKLLISHGASMHDSILPGAQTVEDRVQSIFPDIARRLIAFDAACKFENGTVSDKSRVRRI